MYLDSNYLRNRISEYRKEELLDRCIILLQEQHDNLTFPIWSLLILIKWSSQFAGTKSKLKELTDKRFWTVLDGIIKLNDSHLSSFFAENKSFKVFYALYNQQFYLQSNSSVEDFAVQLKLYTTVKRSFDIETLFYDKSGITIQNFIKICHFLSLVMRRKDVYKEYFYNNRVNESFVFLLENFTSKSVGRAFISTLTKNIRLNERTTFLEKNEIRLLHLQPLGISVFSQHPFIYYKGNLYLTSKKLFNYTVRYYIHDFLKNESFSTEFGRQIERFIESSLVSFGQNFFTENMIKGILPAKSKVVDFYLREDNVFVECKASDMQPYASANPQDDLLLNSLKSSLLKAYFDQLQTVARFMSPDKECWGIIVTFKELFWSDFRDLYSIAVSQQDNLAESIVLPPENVFIIDLYSWNRLLAFAKCARRSLNDILNAIRVANSSPDTRKLLFSMHLDELIAGVQVEPLDYLKNELDFLKP